MSKEYFVARADEITERVMVQTDENIRIGVFKLDDQFVAYQDRCAHSGGPVCEGVILGKYEQILADDKTVLEEKFSETEMHLVCPWHGWEFDLKTGACAVDPKFRLRPYKVEVRGGDVYVHA